MTTIAAEREGALVQMPAGLMRHLSYAIGPMRDAHLETQTGRSTVWRVRRGEDEVAVKVDRDGEAGRVAREAVVLQAIGAEIVGRGEFGARSWVALPWRYGRTTYERWTLVRAGSTHPQSRRNALTAALELANTIAALHATGWVHGDLRPEHCLHGNVGAYLTGWGDARAEGRVPLSLEEEFPYTGGSIDLAAPEVCRAIADGHVPSATREAEVYTLAATLWQSWTGRAPVDYSTVGVESWDTAVRRAAAVGSGLPPPPVAHRVGWGALESVLRLGLAFDAPERPPASAFVRALERVMTSVGGW